VSTLRLFADGVLSVHPTAAWYLSELGEFRGKQELYTRQPVGWGEPSEPQRIVASLEIGC
jgi:hypothetical protein